MTSTAELVHVSVRRQGRLVLEDVSLAVHAGEFVAVVGPNGAGKSTLLATLVGLVFPSEGEVRLFGTPLGPHNARALRKRIGFLPQASPRPPALPVRVAEFVAMGLAGYARPWGLSRQERAQVQEALEALGIAALAQMDLRRLSGGQYQRARIARALVRKPQLLLLDEPAAALDAPARDRLFRLLRALANEGAAVLTVEHDVAAVSRHADGIACLNRRLHQHARKGERISKRAWQAMYGEARPLAHEPSCIGEEA